jgi:hypothetical protein
MSSTFCKHCNRERKNHEVEELINCILATIKFQ